jgi:hypothetical protein
MAAVNKPMDNLRRREVGMRILAPSSVEVINYLDQYAWRGSVERAVADFSAASHKTFVARFPRRPARSCRSVNAQQNPPHCSPA